MSLILFPSICCRSSSSIIPATHRIKAIHHPAGNLPLPRPLPQRHYQRPPHRASSASLPLAPRTHPPPPCNRHPSPESLPKRRHLRHPTHSEKSVHAAHLPQTILQRTLPIVPRLPRRRYRIVQKIRESECVALVASAEDARTVQLRS
jgi:hypothetical protein